jgi:hypothetical protein
MVISARSGTYDYYKSTDTDVVSFVGDAFTCPSSSPDNPAPIPELIMSSYERLHTIHGNSLFKFFFVAAKSKPLVMFDVL